MHNNKTPQFAEERRSGVLALLKKQQKVTVAQLCAAFGVSPATARADLHKLEQRGLLQRTHGGALPFGQLAAAQPGKVVANVPAEEEKHRIGRCAAGLVTEGLTIGIDCGTTTMALARHLAGRAGFTAVTYDIHIANYLQAHTEARIILVGGVVRNGCGCTTGAMAVNGLLGLNVDIAFMATDAFAPRQGFTTPHIEYADCKKALLQTANRAVMLMDSSKFSQVALLPFATLGEVDEIITDTGTTPAQMDVYRKMQPGLQIHRV